ncbi:MAG: hypothetical protein ACRELB_25025, partial [Polyangiaceae bacterium]
MSLQPRACVSVTLVLAGALLVACAGAPEGGGFAHGGNGAGGGGGASGSGDDGSQGGGQGSSGGLFGSSSGGSATGDDGGIGVVDVTAACDTGLAIDDTNAVSFARAIGICTSAATDGYGLVSAGYSRAFGSSDPPAPGQSGLVPQFGTSIKPREGVRIGVLSSGYAGNFDGMDGLDDGPTSQFVESGGGPRQGTNYPTGAAPPGFPKAAQGCPQDGNVNDMIDVKLVLKAPADASGFKFDFDFYSSEWPNYVCSNFNDAFVAYLASADLTDNISFDSNHNPVAVNIDFFDRCTPGAPVACQRSNGPNPDPPLSIASCQAGTSELAGTGFGETDQTACNGGNVDATLGGATGWLETQASIRPGEQFTL